MGVTIVLGSFVSTHSRTKAAAYHFVAISRTRLSFNTQPHEGGCLVKYVGDDLILIVSTHSRTKAAAVVSKIHT